MNKTGIIRQFLKQTKMKTLGIIINIIATLANFIFGVKELVNDEPEWSLFHFICGIAAWVVVCYYMNCIKKQTK